MRYGRERVNSSCDNRVIQRLGEGSLGCGCERARAASCDDILVAATDVNIRPVVVLDFWSTRVLIRVDQREV